MAVRGTPDDADCSAVPDGPPKPLIGRDHELARLRRAVAETRQGGQVIVIEGEAGVGKSVLVDDVAQHAVGAGFRLLRTTGTQDEATVRFAGLHDLLHLVLRRADGLPARLRSAVLTTFGLTDDPAPDDLLIRLGALGLLEQLASQRPLLVIAEDAQWLDAASCAVLAFISRRLTGAPILLLTTRRPGVNNPPQPLTVPHLVLSALSDSDSERLVDSLPWPLSTPARSRVLEEAAGNPLRLTELPAALHEQGLHEALHLPQHLPLTRRLWSVQGTAVPNVPGPGQHQPLLPAADACTARHRAVETFGVGHAVPVPAAAGAAGSLAPGDDVGWALAEAAEAARQDGRTAEVEKLVERAQAHVVDPMVRARLLLTHTLSGIVAGGAGVSIDGLLATARTLGRSRHGSTAERAAAQVEILSTAALAAHSTVTAPDVRQRVLDDLVSLDEGRADPQWSMAMALLDPVGQAVAVPPAGGVVGRRTTHPPAMLGLGLAAEALQDLRAAAQHWSVSVEHLRRAGPSADLASALVHRGRLRTVTGDFAEAVADLEDAERLATDLRIPLVSAAVAAVTARVYVWRGDRAAALAAIKRSKDVADADPRSTITADTSWATGLAALVEHRHRQAWTGLSGVSAHPVTALWAIADLAEAASRAGEIGPAREAVEDAERAASALDSPHVKMLVHRSRALLSRDDEAAEHFDRSLAAGAGYAPRLEVARTELAYGEWLRRRRRVRPAREHLTDALSAFSQVGAQPWITRASAELRAAGVANAGAVGGVTGPRALLTAQELQVADLAATGMTNKEIADRVHLSHRTVGAHLYRVFPKLGVTTRGQLSDALHRRHGRPSGADAHESPAPPSTGSWGMGAATRVRAVG